MSAGLQRNKNLSNHMRVSHPGIRFIWHIWDEMRPVSCMSGGQLVCHATALYAMQGLDVNDLRHRLNSRRSADPKPEQPQQRASLVSQVGQVSRSQPPSHSQAPRVVRSELDFRPVSEVRSELDFRPINDHRTELAPRGSDRGSGRLVQIEEPMRRPKRQNSRRGG